MPLYLSLGMERLAFFKHRLYFDSLKSIFTERTMAGLWERVKTHAEGQALTSQTISPTQIGE